MTRTAEFHLRLCRELTRIHWSPVPFRMLRRSGVAALALHSGNNWFEMLIDFRRVARKARPRIALALFQTQRIFGIARSACILADGDAVLMKLREVANARFAYGAAFSYQRGLSLRSSA